MIKRPFNSLSVTNSVFIELNPFQSFEVFCFDAGIKTGNKVICCKLIELNNIVMQNLIVSLLSASFFFFPPTVVS